MNLQNLEEQARKTTTTIEVGTISTLKHYIGKNTNTQHTYQKHIDKETTYDLEAHILILSNTISFNISIQNPKFEKIHILEECVGKAWQLWCVE